jgi:hypothetical protein
LNINMVKHSLIHSNDIVFAPVFESTDPDGRA